MLCFLIMPHFLISINVKVDWTEWCLVTILPTGKPWSLGMRTQFGCQDPFAFTDQRSVCPANKTILRSQKSPKDASLERCTYIGVEGL